MFFILLCIEGDSFRRFVAFIIATVSVLSLSFLLWSCVKVQQSLCRIIMSSRSKTLQGSGDMRRPRSKTDRPIEQTWTLPRGVRQHSMGAGGGMNWAQDDMSTSSRRNYMTNGPARPAPSPPVRVTSIRPARKAPPPPSASSRSLKLPIMMDYPPEPPPIPSSPRPSMPRPRFADLELRPKSSPPDVQEKRGSYGKEKEKPVPPLPNRSLSHYPAPSQPFSADSEELYELTPSLKMKNDSPPPLPTRSMTVSSRPSSVSSRPSSASSLTLPLPKPPSMSTLPAQKPPAPPATNPPGPRPPPPPPPPPSVPQLPPKPDKYKNFLQDESGAEYCDVDNAIQLKAEYELSQKASQLSLASEVEKNAKSTPSWKAKVEEGVMEEYEEDVYEPMASQIVEDDYIVMSPVSTLIKGKKKGKEGLSDDSLKAPTDSLVSEPAPVLPPKPQISSTHLSSLPNINNLSNAKKKCTNNGEVTNPPKMPPKKASALCLPPLPPSTPPTAGLVKTIPKNKTSVPHLPPPSPPSTFQPPPVARQVKKLPKNRTSIPSLPPPSPNEDLEEEEEQGDYEPIQYNDDENLKIGGNRDINVPRNKTLANPCPPTCDDDDDEEQGDYEPISYDDGEKMKSDDEQNIYV